MLDAEQGLREILTAINSGEESVAYAGDDPDYHAHNGDVPFLTESGWRIVVFNDCGDWDYIDHAVAPWGERVDFETSEVCQEWRPTLKEAWRINGRPFTP